jgi:Na+/phosphate symporter
VIYIELFLLLDHQTLENHIFFTITPMLVALEPTILWHRVEYFTLFVLMFGVMLILPIPCLFVLLRLAAKLRVT